MKFAQRCLLHLIHLNLSSPCLNLIAGLFALLLHHHIDHSIGILLHLVKLVLLFKAETRRKIPKIVAEIRVNHSWCHLSTLRLLIEKNRGRLHLSHEPLIFDYLRILFSTLSALVELISSDFQLLILEIPKMGLQVIRFSAEGGLDYFSHSLFLKFV